MNTPWKTTNILLFGETGNGKSTLGNQILGLDAFVVSDDVKSETKQTYGRKGKGENSNLFVIDTPGLQDTSGADKEHMIQLVNYIKDHKELNAIIVVFNYQQVRFPYNIQTMLKLFCNIFPMKEVGNHIALIFTNSFSKRGELTEDQKQQKLAKVLPEFKRVIEEASGSKLNNIVSGFVDIDPEEGIDERGKFDLDRIITWASTRDNLNVDKINTPEPDVRKETQDFDEMRIDGEYIYKTRIKKERDVYCQLDGSISYGEWKEISRKEERIINPEIEKIKKLNIDKEEMIKKIQEDNEKRMKELKEENTRIQDKAHKQFLEMIASNQKSEKEYERQRLLLQEDDRRRREEEERRYREERDERRREELQRSIEEKKEKEKRRKYLEERLRDIINSARNMKEDKKGECDEKKRIFEAGITEDDDLVKFAQLDPKDSEFKTEWGLLSKQEKVIEKAFNNKIIVGWRLKSEHENEKGGSWERPSDVLGTSSYQFILRTNRNRGCHWKLSIWLVDKRLPLDIE